jgi:hypothetical protein
MQLHMRLPASLKKVQKIRTFFQPPTRGPVNVSDTRVQLGGSKIFPRKWRSLEDSNRYEEAGSGPCYLEEADLLVMVDF